MDKLFELGISEDSLIFMLEQCYDIINMSDKEISDKIDILRYVLCNDRQIKNIISSNPKYLVRIDDDVLKLIKYLKDIGFNSLNMLFDENPYFLNYDVFEIEEYINDRLNSGITLDEVIDEIKTNPFIIE